MLFLITLLFLHAPPLPPASVFSAGIRADLIAAIAPGTATRNALGSSAPVAPIKPAPGALVIKTTVSSSDPPTRAQIRAEQRRRNLWFGLTIAQHSAAAFDAYATRRSISSGGSSGGVQELNPMLRPFAGNSSLYVAIQVAPAVLDYVARRMMTSRHRWMRDTWWIPQAVGTAVSLGSGVHDMGVRAAGSVPAQ
jgi:hypothetical protein